MLDRHLAQRLARAHAAGPAGGGEHRELGDGDAAAERHGQRDPRAPGSKPAGTTPWSASTSTIADASGRRQHAEHGRDERQDQRLGGEQPPDLRRRGAERAQHGGLPPALGDREGERARHHEQRDGAGDPAHGAEDRDQACAIGRVGIGGVGLGAVVGGQHVGVDRGPQARLQPPADTPALRDHADGVDLARRAGLLRGDRVGEEHRATVVGAARRRGR